MRPILRLLPFALLMACGPAKPSGQTFTRPYYELKAVDSDCTRDVVVDADGQIWNENTCTAPGFTKGSTVTPTELSTLATDFQRLPQPPNTTCPGDSAGNSDTSTGTSPIIGDGRASSTVTLSSVTTSKTQTWAACQSGGEFVSPYDAVVVTLTGQI